MKHFTKDLLSSKKISVWGIGYLGYTTILHLQAKGFFIHCATLEKKIQNDLHQNKYPYERMKQSWSSSNDLPRIDFSRVSFDNDYAPMFEANVHIIALPAYIETGKPETYTMLVDIFSRYPKQLENALILFQSAEKAGTVDDFFITPLKNTKVKSHYASSFRSDWNIEEFLTSKNVKMIAANDTRSLAMAQTFFDILEIKTDTLPSIKEAEIYENAKNCLDYTAEAFFTQLSFAYPDINTKEISEKIAKNFRLSSKNNGLNLLNLKNLLYIDHILSTQNSDYLTIIKETQAINLSTVLMYADILKHKEITSVTIMGLSIEGVQKDIRGSASVILAEYLHNLGITVYIHDPYFNDSEIHELFPFALVSILTNPSSFTDSYIIMGSNPSYYNFSQAQIDHSGLFDARIIIDGIGIFRHFAFSSTTIYHEVGDGRLKALLK